LIDEAVIGKRVVAGLLGWLAVAVTPAMAAPELVTGFEGSAGRGYGFASPAFTFPASHETAWVVRGTLSYLYYDFREEGGRTKVRSPGESIAILFRYSTPQLTADFGPGYEIRQTRRDLASGGHTDVDENGVTVTGDVFYQITPLTNVNLIATYGGANHYTWARAGIKRQITNLNAQEATSMYVGAEVTGQGNSDGHTAQIGGLFEVAFPQDRASLQLRAGYSRLRNPDGSKESHPYYGIGYYRAF